MKDNPAKSFTEKMEKDGMLGIAKTILDGIRICDSCLGRQFGRLATGMTNLERGKIIRRLLGAKPVEGRCEICGGLLQGGIEVMAAKAVKRLERIEYGSFVVGSRLGNGMVSQEERIWRTAGISYCEPVKTELNREIGKLIARKTRKRVDELNPDVLVLIDFEKNDAELHINPLFVYGEYMKMARGIPQTKWDMYKVTVEDIIAKPFMKATKGKAHAMHGAGREDIDARCLDWRPFVLEITEPVKRKVSLREMEAQVNKSKKANVRRMRLSARREIARIKSERHDKTYRMVVRLEKPVQDGELKKLTGIVGTIRQRTPSRVMHRRADLLRTRKVKSIRWEKVSNKKIELEVRGEAGLYVKELVTGDCGRTQPSVAEMLGNPAKVLSLDVIKIHGKRERHG